MRLTLAALVITALIVPIGCGLDGMYKSTSSQNDAPGSLPHHDAYVNSDAPPPPPSTAPDNNSPRVITDLSQVSGATTKPVVSGAKEEAFAKTAKAGGPQAEVTRYDIDRFYLARQPIAMDPQDEGVKPLHGDVTLLNKKATRYPEFSYQMLNRTLPVAEKSAAAKLNGQQLPGDLERVILTATLTPTGRLSDIAIEQHSGVAAVDHIMIDACKQGLWAMNPPPEAAGPDKNYRVHFEGVIFNYSFDRHGQYSYITHIGVGLL